MNRFFGVCLLGILGFVLVSATVLSGKLEKKAILNDRVEVLVPADFEVMSEELMRVKYPSERRPTLVYSDKAASVNVAFNHTTNRATQAQLEAYKNNFVATFKNMYPTAEWLGSGVKEINGRKVGYLELVTPAVDQKVYNLMFFTDLDGRLLLATFNCVDRKRKDWLEPAQQIMHSLTVK